MKCDEGYGVIGGRVGGVKGGSEYGGVIVNASNSINAKKKAGENKAVVLFVSFALFCCCLCCGFC